MKQKLQRESHVRRGRGQSLVEFTLALPMLLLIVAGVLEVGNVLTQYLRLNQVVREGARFGAAGGTNDGILSIVQDSAAGGLLVDDDHMSAWVVRPVVETGAPWIWESGSTTDWGVTTDCLMGDDCASIPLTPAEALTNLQNGSASTNLDGTRIVIVVVRYEVETLLNLPFFQAPGQAGDRIPINAVTYMTQEVDQATVTMLSGGCSAYPIGIDVSVTAGGATEGQLFTVVQDTDFRYLDWRPGGTLQASLAFPGNSTDTTGPAGYLNPTDALDTQMHRDDPVSVEGTLGTIAGTLDSHITSGRTLRLIIYDVYDSGNGWVEISGFAVFRIDSRSGTNNLTLEFVRWDSSCGFDS